MIERGVRDRRLTSVGSVSRSLSGDLDHVGCLTEASDNEYGYMKYASKGLLGQESTFQEANC